MAREGENQTAFKQSSFCLVKVSKVRVEDIGGRESKPPPKMF